jgi:predicted transcriptional regulator
MIALPHSTRDQAHRAYLAGIRVTQIAHDLGLKRATVAQWACRGQWKEERKAIVARTIETVGRTVEDVTNRHILQHFEQVNQLVSAKIDSLAEMPLKEANSVLELANALEKLDNIARRNLGLSNEGPAAVPAQFCMHDGDMSSPC